MNSSTIIDLIGPYLLYDELYEFRKIDAMAHMIVLDMFIQIRKSLSHKQIQHIKMVISDQKMIYIYRISDDSFMCRSMCRFWAKSCFKRDIVFVDKFIKKYISINSYKEIISICTSYRIPTFLNIKTIYTTINNYKFVDLKTIDDPKMITISNRYIIIEYDDHIDMYD